MVVLKMNSFTRMELIHATLTIQRALTTLGLDDCPSNLDLENPFTSGSLISGPNVP